MLLQTLTTNSELSPAPIQREDSVVLVPVLERTDSIINIANITMQTDSTAAECFLLPSWVRLKLLLTLCTCHSCPLGSHTFLRCSSTPGFCGCCPGLSAELWCCVTSGHRSPTGSWIWLALPVHAPCLPFAPVVLIQLIPRSENTCHVVQCFSTHL